MNNLNIQNFNSLDTDMADRFISAITKLINDDINYLTYSSTIKPFKEYLAIFIIGYNKIIEQFFGNNNLLLLTRNLFTTSGNLSIDTRIAEYSSTAQPEYSLRPTPSNYQLRPHIQQNIANDRNPYLSDNTRGALSNGRLR